MGLERMQDMIRAAQTVTDWFYRSRRRLATAAVALLAVVIAYHAVFGANGMVVYQHKKTEYRSLQHEIEVRQGENDRLQQQIKALKSADPATIEKEAREQLRYTRPGETVYIVPEPEKRPSTTPATAQGNPATP